MALQLERLLDGLAKDGVRVMLWRSSRGRGWKVEVEVGEKNRGTLVSKGW